MKEARNSSRPVLLLKGCKARVPLLYFKNEVFRECSATLKSERPTVENMHLKRTRSIAGGNRKEGGGDGGAAASQRMRYVYMGE
jgi:hypothetical protein